MSNFNKLFENKIIPLGYKKTPTDECLFGIFRMFNEQHLKQMWRELDWYKQGLAHLKGDKVFEQRVAELCKGNTAIISETKGFYRTYVWNQISGEFIKDYDVSEAMFFLVKDTGSNGVKAICKEFNFDEKTTLSTDDVYAINNISKEDVLDSLDKIRVNLIKIMRRYN